MAEAAAPGTTAAGPGAAAAAPASSPAAAPPPVTAGPGAGGGGGGWTKQVTCRYFMHGVCKEGNNCRYSHDLSTSQSAMVCRYYQRGCCAYGDRCRYEHTKPLKREEVTTVTPAAKTYPSASSDLTSLPEILEASTGETEIENTNLAAAGVGAEDWVNAVEFVPGQPYCGRAAPSCTETPLQGMVIEEEYEKQQANVEMKKQLCPYAAVGECRYGENCVYIHGDVCDMCGLQVLHPVDAAQRSQHIKSCIEAHEKDMELSFAVQRSKDMVCGICMEVVYEKANPSERRFGILSNCNHTYCLKCIRKWRSAKQFESKIIKSCPECRITSNFVIPSEYWVEEKEEKQKLIQKYKEAMSNKPCRYFDEGRGSCPFGGNCFYKHAYPDGRREEPQRPKVGTSSRYRAQRRNRFWEFIEERENSDPFENDEDEVVTFELGEMLLMLLAAGGDDELTDSEDEWDLFHDELEDYYDLDL
ncbi:E3 ubiquitin-protein ligase makorin-1 isoform X1 [Alligator mississippiensis]|uniref:RING-type E3 ubiquitin transferase n=1 Tax=Alligator mississippiensis TaxID=8496 RepID=A0A151NI79_ALLMI|nr:E3 ubiquitin-protein ligase makorin-1 isoform X1 [Alligator mississippiensis]KYO36506.1 E3 ubiquitin-protein ligase makorin-1 [Alligator mississippiensis]